jgi:hypothetical protein
MIVTVKKIGPTDADAELSIAKMLDTINNLTGNIDEAYRRLARRMIPEYIRWMTTESRNGISQHECIEAIAKMCGWLMANEAFNVIKGVGDAMEPQRVLDHTVDRVLSAFQGCVNNNAASDPFDTVGRNPAS